MEVCGTHTMAISRSGIRDILPEKIKLISGPGCPVCVTSSGDIDGMIELADKKDVIITTFGDMLRVPGSNKNSLEKKKSDGADIRIVYSPMESLAVALSNPQKKVVFLSVGFETTIPPIAGTVLEAEKQGIDNFMIFPANKLIPPAMELLIEDKSLKIDGFICPGHVSIIIGAKPYKFIADEGIPCVISGFDSMDIVRAIYKLMVQTEEKKARVDIEYKWVKENGNPRARDVIYNIFEPCDAPWRGLGTIPLSGLKLKKEFLSRDGGRFFGINSKNIPEPPGCQCGEILKGIKNPDECRLFGTVCTPVSPVGPCMVSAEGSCSIYYKFRDG